MLFLQAAFSFDMSADIKQGEPFLTHTLIFLIASLLNLTSHLHFNDAFRWRAHLDLLSPPFTTVNRSILSQRILLTRYPA